MKRRINTLQRTVLKALCLAWILGIYAAAAQEEPRARAVVLVIGKQSPVDSLSLKDLKSIYKGHRIAAFQNKTLTLAYLRGDLEDTFNQKILGLSTKKVNTYWLRKVFQGEGDVRKYFNNAAEAKRFIAVNDHAIGFIYADELDDSIKAIAIDGRSIKDPNYLLRPEL